MKKIISQTIQRYIRINLNVYFNRNKQQNRGKCKQLRGKFTFKGIMMGMGNRLF